MEAKHPLTGIQSFSQKGSGFILNHPFNRSTNMALFLGLDCMIDLLKHWITPSATVIIHIGSGKHRFIRKSKFTIGYGSVNTWNIDIAKPPARLLAFKKRKTNLEVEPVNPGDDLLLDGKPWAADILAMETEYTLQIHDEQFILCRTRDPKAWIRRIRLEKWLVFEPETGAIFGPLDKLQLKPWVIAERKDPEKLIYYPEGSAKGFYISQVIEMELPAAKPQQEIIKEKIKEHRPYSTHQPDRLRHQAQCPHCWSPYHDGDLLAVATHESLRGDPLLGEDEMLRFEADSFNDKGVPLDATGTPCLERACPQCRLKIPHGLSDIPQAFISILGSPGAGKSYFLAVLIDELQKKSFEKWNFLWKDADPTANSPLNSMRHRLFSARNAPEAYLAKTSLDGHLYSKVKLNGRPTLLPRPFTYILEGEGHKSQSLTFYDNAGEHFQPGSDGTSNPVTHHLAHAHLWCFLFDPSKDMAFRNHSNTSKDPQLGRRYPTESQELLLSELENRIRVLHQLSPLGKLNTPLAFIINKSDMIEEWEPIKRLQDPWNGHHFSAFVVEENSRILREALKKRVPAMVARAEAISEKVIYFTSTSFGHAPRRIKTGELSPVPKNLKPCGVEIPIFWWLNSWSTVFNNRNED
jgi:hypothetical protein